MFTADKNCLYIACLVPQATDRIKFHSCLVAQESKGCYRRGIIPISLTDPSSKKEIWKYEMERVQNCRIRMQGVQLVGNLDRRLGGEALDEILRQVTVVQDDPSWDATTGYSTLSLTENRVGNWATSILMIVSLFHPDTVAVMDDERRSGPSSYEFNVGTDVHNAGHRTTDFPLRPVIRNTLEPSRGESPSATPGPQSQTTVVKEQHDVGLRFSFQIAAYIATLTGHDYELRQLTEDYGVTQMSPSSLAESPVDSTFSVRSRKPASDGSHGTLTIHFFFH
ncbi:hypothetical protein F5146DRAFT_1000097 [Armillaria mellea]|nr:hypothetical protein F5146DRAFT_1000097 [Armillaria mellea]